MPIIIDQYVNSFVVVYLSYDSLVFFLIAFGSSAATRYI